MNLGDHILWVAVYKDTSRKHHRICAAGSASVQKGAGGCWARPRRYKGQNGDQLEDSLCHSRKDHFTTS